MYQLTKVKVKACEDKDINENNKKLLTSLTSMQVAPASIAFSTNSFTAEETDVITWELPINLIVDLGKSFSTIFNQLTIKSKAIDNHYSLKSTLTFQSFWYQFGIEGT